MKKTITIRSLEERARFYKKNLHKIELGGSSEKIQEKKPMSVHQLVENAALKIEEPITEEFLHDEISLDFEEEE